jgi:hypothetical protein
MGFFGEMDYRTPEEREAADTTHEPIVYYMRMDRLVKIGWTINIRRRVGAIGPQGVVAIELGSRSVERQRHKQFVASHSHLEWFWLFEDLAAHIASLRQDIEDGMGMTTEQWLDLHGVRHTSIGEPGARP